MINVIHTDHERLAGVSNLWFARYPAQWRRMQAVANLLDVPLLALIYARLRELQDGAARESFTRQEDFSVVTWEWRERVRGGRMCTELSARNCIPAHQIGAYGSRVGSTS